MHRKMSCAARAAVEAEEVAQAEKAAEGFYRHQMFGERHNIEIFLNWSLSSFPAPRRDNPASSGVCHLRQRVPWLGWSSNPRTLP